jgi:hypothetical protein
MQPAQNPARRTEAIVLHKFNVSSDCLVEGPLVPRLEKKSPFIVKHVRFEQKKTGNFQFGDLHWQLRHSAADGSQSLAVIRGRQEAAGRYALHSCGRRRVKSSRTPMFAKIIGTYTLGHEVMSEKG